MPKSCPRCQRELPPGKTRLCVYCGSPLVRGATDPGFRPAQAQPGDPLVGTTVGGRFRVEELVGQGGMGKVYRARHLALERTVVLKVLKPQLLEDPTLVGRFEREAKAASRLNHPNVIQVLDFGRMEGGTLYIVMEHVQGKDLRLILRDEWPLAEERLCNILAQVCSALSEAHANNVIHRDLKPENIMVEARRDQPDHVKVLDFGIAKILDSDTPGLTKNDVVCGTPQYMAPEQATGTALDERCDVYAVGVILYQMATGHLPFDGANSMEVLTRHVNEPPLPPRQRQHDAPISEAMERLILRTLEKDPLKRPQTAEQLREELLAVAELTRTRPVTPHGLSPASLAAPQTHEIVTQPAVPRRAAGKRWIPLAAAAAALLAFGVGLRIWQPSSEPIAVAGVVAQPVQRDPQRALDLIAQSQARQLAGDAAAARELLEQAVRADPRNAEAHFRLGGLFRSSEPQRARAEYEASRRLDPDRYGPDVEQILHDLE